MKRYKYILWDLDGTIINSYEGVSRCVQYALEYYGIHLEGEENLRRFIGPPLRESFPKYAHLPEAYVEAAVARYRERYNPIGVYECELFPDVREAMEMLREGGFIQALSSSKPEARCRDILEKFGLTGYLDEVVGASMDGRIDSKIQVLQETFRRLGKHFRKEDAVLIGDTKYDADGAAQAGIDCIGVSYGFGSREELLEHGVTAVYDSLPELVSDLQGDGNSR
ncbi:MAG: HAD hydrolase-like protein [Clostridiales bacterium]|nr:HAD hydrolase-like protein [Clostridiales bacterium]